MYGFDLWTEACVTLRLQVVGGGGVLRENLIKILPIRIR